MKKYKKGAASFYIVSFSTLILVIIAASFATIIISEVTRASNDDLSQSAYDAALAGVEDAKLAFANYQRCLQRGDLEPKAPNNDGAVSCEEILWWMQPENADCDMVAHMIGRIPDHESGEVPISDTTSTDGSGKTSDLNQAYTCVKIATILKDYKATLSSTSNYRLVRVSLNEVGTEKVKKVRFSWYSTKEGQTTVYSNFGDNKGDNRVTFQPIINSRNIRVQAPTPPTIQIQMVQTADEYTLDLVNSPSVKVGSTWKTDRATLFLVPVEPEEEDGYIRNLGSTDKEQDNFVSAWDEEAGENIITAEQVAITNYQHISIKPYAVECKTDSNYLCEAIIQLPEPLGEGGRLNDTFLFLVTLPYGEPDTDFAMEFLCDDDTVCSVITDESGEVVSPQTAFIKGVQIEIDSTGRTNDLFRRVETRLESMDVSFPFVYYALQILNTGNSAQSLEKNFEVTSEYDREYDYLGWT